MQIEHFGKFRVDLIPFELSGERRWASYLAVHKFDEQAQDFVCVMEKQRVAGDAVFASSEEAIDAARRIANDLIEAGKFQES
jgi:hypothetical protein